MMKRISLLFGLALTLVVISCSNDPSSSGFVVAEGKGIKITRGDLTKERDNQIHVLNLSKEKIPVEQFAMIDAKILEQMIEKTLLLNEVSKMPSVNLDKETEDTFNGIKAKFPNEEAMKQQLAKANLTVDKVKKEIKIQIALEKVVKAKSKPEEIAVTDADVENFYKANPQFWNRPEMVKAQHILVFVEASASDDVKKAKKKIIEDAHQRIMKGEPFEKVAAEVSEDPATKQRGGELPPFAKESRLAKDFTETAFKQKVGQVGQVFSSPYGYHLVKVLERIPARTVPLSEVKDALKYQLEVSKKSQAVQAILKKMKEEAGVKILLPPPTSPNQVMPAGAQAPQQKPQPAPAAAPAAPAGKK